MSYDILEISKIKGLFLSPHYPPTYLAIHPPSHQDSKGFHDVKKIGIKSAIFESSIFAYQPHIKWKEREVNPIENCFRRFLLKINKKVYHKKSRRALILSKSTGR